MYDLFQSGFLSAHETLNTVHVIQSYSNRLCIGRCCSMHITFQAFKSVGKKTTEKSNEFEFRQTVFTIAIPINLFQGYTSYTLVYFMVADDKIRDTFYFTFQCFCLNCFQEIFFLFVVKKYVLTYL